MRKKKRVEIEAETNNPENSQTKTNVNLLNGDAQKKKKSKEEKETNSKAKAEEISTVSISIASFIIDNAQSLDLATRVSNLCFYLLFLPFLLFFFEKKNILKFLFGFSFFFHLVSQIARAATIFQINEVFYLISYLFNLTF